MGYKGRSSFQQNQTQCQRLARDALGLFLNLLYGGLVQCQVLILTEVSHFAQDHFPELSLTLILLLKAK